MKSLALVALFALSSAACTPAESDPFVGTWKLNVGQSRFDPGPGPQSQTRTWAADGRVSVEGVNPAGEPVAYGYTIVGDGVSYPATGHVPNGADAVSSARIDAHTIESHFSRGGEAADTTRFEVSADGRTLTITATGTRPDGGPLADRLVLERQ